MFRYGGKNASFPGLFIMLLCICGAAITGADSLSQTSPNPVESSYKEDYNGDGYISVADAIALLLLGRHDPGNSLADYNGDGRYSITDVVKLLLNIRDGNLTLVNDTTATDTTANGTTPSNPTYAIQGMIYCAEQNLGNVQVSLYDDVNMNSTTFTDANGFYTFLVPDGQYTIIPLEISGYGFNPSSRSVVVAGRDIYNQDFFVFGWESIPADN